MQSTDHMNGQMKAVIWEEWGHRKPYDADSTQNQEATGSSVFLLSLP